MKHPYRVGLVIGLVGLLGAVVVSFAIGVCGPVVSLAAGAVAALIAVTRERPSVQADGARIGTAAAAVAGSLSMVGQLIGGLLANNALHRAGIELPFGRVPGPAASTGEVLTFYLAGLATSACFGLLGIALAAGVGGVVGRLATRPAAPEPPH